MQSPSVQRQIDGIKAWQEQVLNIRERLFKERAERVEHANQNVREMTRIIQAKHEMVRNRISKEAVYREANIRVNRGLDSLQRLIEVLREDETTDDLIARAVRDPVMSFSFRDTRKKAMVSDFVKSIQHQLVAQTEFINIAAHELRTPIMPILTCVETLEAELGQENEEVQMIKRNALRLMRLAENILSLTKIASGNMDLKLEPFDLGALLSEILKENDRRIAAKQCQLRLAISDGVHVNADKDGITRVFFNLLDNAIKFTDQGIISVTVQRKGSEAVVNVSDSGPGIDPKVLPILFTKFVTTSHRGTGLGLYISKEIVNAHGGRILANNNTKYKKPGATFAFTLPLDTS